MGRSTHMLVGVRTSTNGDGMQRTSTKEACGKQWWEVEVELLVVSKRVQPWCKRLYQQCCWTRRRPSLVRPKRLDYYSADTTSVPGRAIGKLRRLARGGRQNTNLGNRAQANVRRTGYEARNEGEKLYENAISPSKKSWQCSEAIERAERRRRRIVSRSPDFTACSSMGLARCVCVMQLASAPGRSFGPASTRAF
jgi:hypothetical protein